ncbi:hypothetical protein PCH_Pc20g14760 [Penicillium rubens Wisconsin 54-1255]|uniref:Uncharacterized protein n=1 Tax=Penicillium rubens (strain ATCC 28089 / DSM 1075 / NRRL 1951 / Wisconsin 54-1255) TaxID=500485 RepID=B6HDT3_PENRW|nr:hypothetical protein PCH_Pc20g14760 [Penicillium rubens Wisconsin 54-1255]
MWTLLERHLIIRHPLVFHIYIHPDNLTRLRRNTFPWSLEARLYTGRQDHRTSAFAFQHLPSKCCCTSKRSKEIGAHLMDVLTINPKMQGRTSHLVTATTYVLG